MTRAVESFEKAPSKAKITSSPGSGNLSLSSRASQAPVGSHATEVLTQQLRRLVLNSASGVRKTADAISSASNKSLYPGFDSSQSAWSR